MGTVSIPLTQGKVALIDEEDFLAVDQYHWAAARQKDGRWYAMAYRMDADGVKRHTLLHRFIMQPPDGVLIDHVNGNGLDCRRLNMREADHPKNMQNRRKTSSETSSSFKGVTWRSHGWEASINGRGEWLYLGSFPTEEEAARSYDSAAYYFYGAFALLNFPGETPAPYAPPDTLTRSETGYRGVVLDKRTGRWRARIYDGTKNQNLGFYATAEEAAIAHDDTAYALHGETARLNFPDRPHGSSQIGRAKASAGKPPSTGHRNVVQVGNRYRVVIYRDRGKTRVNVGYFTSIEDAVRARDAALSE